MDIKEIRRPLIFHLYIIVVQPRAPIIYLDAGQPEVVQRGSPWYKKNLLVHWFRIF